MHSLILAEISIYLTSTQNLFERIERGAPRPRHTSQDFEFDDAIEFEGTVCDEDEDDAVTVAVDVVVVDQTRALGTSVAAPAPYNGVGTGLRAAMSATSANVLRSSSWPCVRRLVSMAVDADHKLPDKVHRRRVR
jgi:hypothetical protein